MKILKNRRTAFPFIGLRMVLALLVFVCFQTDSPQAKTSVAKLAYAQLDKEE